MDYVDKIKKVTKIIMVLFNLIKYWFKSYKIINGIKNFAFKVLNKDKYTELE